MNVFLLQALTFWITISNSYSYYPYNSRRAPPVVKCSNNDKFITSSLRRTVQILLITASVTVNPYSQPSVAIARNLPTSNGASNGNIGNAKSLVPILELRIALDAAVQQLPDLNKCNDKFYIIPKNEKEFKKIFDEHSESVSYKQTFLDQNAFLVYYTQGFDGPGRPSIESDDPKR